MDEYALIQLSVLQEIIQAAYMRGYEDSEDGLEPSPDFDVEEAREALH